MQVFLNQFSKKIKNMNFKILDNKCTHFKFMEYVFNIPKNLFESVELKVSLELYRLEKKYALKVHFCCAKNKNLGFLVYLTLKMSLMITNLSFGLWICLKVHIFINSTRGLRIFKCKV